ncbi:MAG: MoaD/ThiS family protein [Chloroflexota bacterium]|nr:MoaD/ThiS family protein [Chloroflexota bacterium]
MEVNVKLFSRLRYAARENSFSLHLEDDAKLSDLLDAMTEEYGQALTNEIFKIMNEVRAGRTLRIVINGQDYSYLGRLEAPLSDGATVEFHPPYMGGT